MPYEIRITEPGLDYGTTSGLLDLSDSQARELFEQECKTLEYAQTAELIDDEGNVIAKETR